jgi:hypothetical protein
VLLLQKSSLAFMLRSAPVVASRPVGKVDIEDNPLQKDDLSKYVDQLARQ